jgi:hypothetical protein
VCSYRTTGQYCVVGSGTLVAEEGRHVVCDENLYLYQGFGCVVEESERFWD